MRLSVCVYKLAIMDLIELVALLRVLSPVQTNLKEMFCDVAAWTMLS